jgi:transcriptional regulator with XRE-family HTH domain
MTNKPAALLPVLLADVCAFAKAKKGRVNALAADLQTAQPTVSAWLNGHQAPGGEAALQLAAWLERAKAAEAAELAAAATKTADALKSLAARRETAPAE